ncbi:MAG: enoyl-[acyl-carrier-protein] reductase FabK [Lachnospiraceae bacterium]|nr:enoyl-[acyl-carrier-protein] reductase FabK [Lachnospiraceae bacterium]
MKTRLTEMLSIRYPIFQGGMAWVAEHSLAGAVSKAGGLGIIGAGGAPASVVEKELWELKKNTDAPFGLNIMLLSPYVSEIVELAVQYRPAVVTTGAGSPEGYIEKFHSAGIKVIPVIASTALAKRMERCGADAVIAEGCESGGHIGELTTMALVPQVCDAVSIPVIAAGGIADGRGFAAAMMLGAQGIQIGTRFLTAEECVVHEQYKERVLAARDIDSVVTGRSHGHPVRSLRNSMTREYGKLEKEGKSFEELEPLTLGALRAAVVDGDVTNGTVMAGQIAGLVKERLTCAQILEQMTAQAEECLKKGGCWIE